MISMSEPMNCCQIIFEKTKKEPEESAKEYSWFDKFRMVIEVLIFGWLMPGRRKSKKVDDRSADSNEADPQ